MTRLGRNHPPLAGDPVVLVNMPYSAVHRPSIALAILKAALQGSGIPTRVLYANMLFAEVIGTHPYDLISKSYSHHLAGEWTFSPVAFPDFEPDHESYFHHTVHNVRAIDASIRCLGGRIGARDLFQKVREMAPAFVTDLARRIVESGARIVGCTSTFQQHVASLALLREIKQLDPSVVTMIGGANCEASMGVATHREADWVDYVVSGEAELVLPTLCRRILSGDEVGPLAGVIGPTDRTEETYAELARRPPRAVVENMALSPTPDYEEYFEAIAWSAIGDRIRPGLLVETSRGCWWGALSHCTFCGLNGEGMGFRSKPAEKVLAELELLSERHGITGFEVVDNILDLKYIKTLLPQLAEKGYLFFYETKSNLRAEDLDRMAAAGIRWIQPGIESFDREILDKIAKGTSGCINLQLMKRARERGIFIAWLLLYEIPQIPDENYRRMAEWLPLISHLYPPRGLSFIQYNRFSPYHMRPEAFGIALEAERSYQYVYPWSAERLEEFAYFFDDYRGDREFIEVGTRKVPERPGLALLRKVYTAWNAEWEARPTEGDEGPVALTMEDDGEVLRITDTRRCRTATRHELTGLTRAVCLTVDAAPKAESLAARLEREHGLRVGARDLSDAVNDLVDRNLVLRLDDHLIGLALKSPVAALPDRKLYPGGQLVSFEEAVATRLVPQALSAASQAPAAYSVGR